ncbi:MAG: hypothetical protein ACR2PG_17020 [Hyphomicrobiaceae bacterium]
MLVVDKTQVPVAELAAGFSIEATPEQITREKSLENLLPPGTEVYVPSLPGSDPGNVVDACARLIAAQLKPVPHIAVRTIADAKSLERRLRGLRSVGADRLLLIAGDSALPAGPFASTLDVLATGCLKQQGFRKIGFAGHPEGHPCVDEHDLWRALLAKLSYAEETNSKIWLNTQFTFAAPSIHLWLDQLDARGISLPVRVGIPGPAQLRSLLSFAMKLGVATSARALSRRPETTQLLFRQWTPLELICELAAYLASHPKSSLSGLHVFSFGGFAYAAGWMQSLQVTNIENAEDAQSSGCATDQGDVF